MTKRESLYFKNKYYSRFKVFYDDHKFYLKNGCPYCSGKLVIQANEWEEDKHGLWIATSFDMDCMNEPDIDSDECEDFMNQHTQYPYIYWLPLQQDIQHTFNKKYRFLLK